MPQDPGGDAPPLSEGNPPTQLEHAGGADREGGKGMTVKCWWRARGRRHSTYQKEQKKWKREW